MSKPVEQADIGDELTRSTWFGLFEEKLKVVDIDKDRRYAMACNEKNGSLFIVNLFRNSANDKVGIPLPAHCSCKTYMNAAPEDKHKLAWGF